MNDPIFNLNPYDEIKFTISGGLPVFTSPFGVPVRVGAFSGVPVSICLDGSGFPIKILNEGTLPSWVKRELGLETNNDPFKYGP